MLCRRSHSWYIFFYNSVWLLLEESSQPIPGPKKVSQAFQILGTLDIIYVKNHGMLFSILGPMNLVYFIQTTELLLQDKTYLIIIVLKLFVCMCLKRMVINAWKLKPYWSRLIIVSNVDTRDSCSSPSTCLNS